LFYLNIIFNNNRLGTSIHLAHCGLSLKKFHHGKNWSLVFVAIQKPPAFPHHCEVLKTDDTTVKGQTFNTVMNSDLICMTNGTLHTAPLSPSHTQLFSEATVLVLQQMTIRNCMQALTLYLVAQSMLLKT